ncbi:MAG: hypothetical protein LBL33_03850 [Tannerella sp.]|jgi:hypothetical protein|nr:hypothetical protein [Tannerella sp.]
MSAKLKKNRESPSVGCVSNCRIGKTKNGDYTVCGIEDSNLDDGNRRILTMKASFVDGDKPTRNRLDKYMPLPAII